MKRSFGLNPLSRVNPLLDTLFMHDDELMPLSEPPACLRFEFRFELTLYFLTEIDRVLISELSRIQLLGGIQSCYDRFPLVPGLVPRGWSSSSL